MPMRYGTWLLLAALLAFVLLSGGALAQEEATADQAAMSQSQTTVSSTVPPAVAQGTTVAPGMMGVAPGQMMMQPGMMAYNPNMEVSLTGVVVNGPILAAPMDNEFQMVIRTPDGARHRVWLAPAPFMRRTRFAPAVNDQVTVIGMPMGASGDIVARQVTWGGRAYDLRNAQGVPMWQGRGRYRYRAGAGTFSEYSSLWNSNRVRTVSGRIDRIEEFYPEGNAMGPGVAVRVRLAGLEQEDIPSWQQPMAGLAPNYVWVHLGPSWYVQQQFPDLHEGQAVTITGAPAEWRGQPVLLASSMQVGSRVIAFRNSSGYPMWASGWRGWNQAPVVGALPYGAYGNYYGMYPSGMYGMNMPYGTYGSAYGGMYGSFQTISGTIQSVQTVPAMGGFGSVTWVTILTPSNNLVSVALSPASFAQQTGVPLMPGQPISVVASSSFVNGQPVLFANQVFYNNQQFAMSTINGMPSWSAGSMVGMAPGYNVASGYGSLQTISGTITNVQDIAAMGAFGPATLVTIQTANNCLGNVVIAPSSFAQQMGVQLMPGQPITVVASMSSINNQPALIASLVFYNNQQFVMNNLNGTMSWSVAAAPTATAALPPAGTVAPGY